MAKVNVRELFGGFDEHAGVALATVEKAVLDYFYVACGSGHPDRRLPDAGPRSVVPTGTPQLSDIRMTGSPQWRGDVPRSIG